MPSRHLDSHDEQQPEDVSFFEFLDRMVNLALQAHGAYTPELSQTIGEIIQVAGDIAHADTKGFKKGLFDLKKIQAADKEAVIRAIAIYKAVAAEMFGMTYAQIEKKIDKYAKEFGDV